MQLQIITQQINIGDNQRDYIQSKVENLQKYEENISDESTRIRVDVGYTKVKSDEQRIEVQITIYPPHSVIRAEVNASTVEEAVDLAVEKLKRQIERYKTKKHRRDKGGKWIPTSTLEDAAGGLSEADFEQIVKRKKYENVEPMTEEEAVEQMELLQHNFYAFVNSDTNLFTVVYKRQDGDYGMIELEKKSY